ncbi:hypothetical protein ACO2I3_09005 [Leptospira interrogans]
MSEQSKIRWLNVIGVVAATAALCAVPLYGTMPRPIPLHPWTDAFRLLVMWIGLVLVAAVPASISALASQRRGSADPTKTGVHVGVIAVAVATIFASLMRGQ